MIMILLLFFYKKRRPTEVLKVGKDEIVNLEGSDSISDTILSENENDKVHKLYSEITRIINIIQIGQKHVIETMTKKQDDVCLVSNTLKQDNM